VRKTRTKTIQETVDIICNKCGESLRREGSDDWYSGLQEAHVSSMPDSAVLEPRTAYWFSMCEPCLKVLFSKFILPPKRKQY
jgi:hypothetical protein